jgi:hypothetical protein
VDDPGIELGELVEIEPRRRPAEDSISGAGSVNGSTGRLVPSRPSLATRAIGSIPCSLSESAPSEPSRFDSFPSDPTRRASWAKAGGSAPRASNIWSWSAVLATWSSPRSTWVTPISMSSTLLGSM